MPPERRSAMALPCGGPPGERRTLATRLAGLLLAGFLNIAPSAVPPWRLDPGPIPAVTLVVGGHVVSLNGRAR